MTIQPETIQPETIQPETVQDTTVQDTTVHLPSADTNAPIEVPTACQPYEVGDGITVLPSYLPVPGMGVLPAHAFLIDGPEPVLVDTGPGGAEAGFRSALASVTDVGDLRWIWLTHTDPDHTGSLQWLIDNAPAARVITTYLAVGKLSMQMTVPMDRLYWVNPGTSVEINRRRLEAIRPPSFDAPETTAFFDHRSKSLFSADSFGALLHRPSADAADVSTVDLDDGMVLWSTIDSPWVTRTDRSLFAHTLNDLRSFGARRVLSSHLPPATGLTDRLIANLSRVPGSNPWLGPDQGALDQILASMTGVTV